MSAGLQLAPSPIKAQGSPESARVELVLLDMTRQYLREVRNILDDTNSKRALRIQSGQGSIGLEINRGDQPIQNATARLFWGTSENPEGPYRILIPGLSINRLDPKNSSYDADLIIKALTIDGSGGTLDWTTEGIPLPCLWYYIENFFVKTPDHIALSQFKGVRGRRSEQGFSEWILPDVFGTTHTGQLQEWFATNYRPKKDTCPTHRPITEEYLSQLQGTRLSPSQKKAKGELFFGRKNYHDLLSRV